MWFIYFSITLLILYLFFFEIEIYNTLITNNPLLYSFHWRVVYKLELLCDEFKDKLFIIIYFIFSKIVYLLSTKLKNIVLENFFINIKKNTNKKNTYLDSTNDFILLKNNESFSKKINTPFLFGIESNLKLNEKKQLNNSLNRFIKFNNKSNLFSKSIYYNYEFFTIKNLFVNKLNALEFNRWLFKYTLLNSKSIFKIDTVNIIFNNLDIKKIFNYKSYNNFSKTLYWNSIRSNFLQNTNSLRFIFKKKNYTTKKHNNNLIKPDLSNYINETKFSNYISNNLKLENYLNNKLTFNFSKSFFKINNFKNKYFKLK